MVVAIAGAHGKIALHLTRSLTDSGDDVIGLIRNPDHAADVSQSGASPVICDLEHASVVDVTRAVSSADAVVFAAGAGPGSGAARKVTMDRDGAIKLLQAATAVGAQRYLIISSVGAEAPPADDDGFSVYLRAKAQADEAVRASELDWTIVRPGPLTDDPATGHVRIDLEPFRASVPRADVAAVFARLLHDRRAARRIIYLAGGDDPIERALEGELGASSR